MDKCELVEAQQLQAQVDLILGLQGLGRSPTLERLLRFLLTTALEGRSPKGTEIADAVWDRLPGDRDADASVRVNIHRLRHKLERFYTGPGHDQAWQLVLPSGTYMLSVQRVGASDDQVEPEPASPSRPAPARRRWLAFVGLALACTAAGWAIGTWRHDPTPIEAVQATALWRPMLEGDHRTALVLGDYYIFGERDAQGNIGRLIREFDVNSPGDLDDLKSMDPARARGYTDLDLAYLPVGVGAALRSVAPVMQAGKGTGVVQVITASQLSVPVVQTTSLVYLGYISGLGILRSAEFDGSRFAIGSSFDEIIDRRTGRHYLASSHLKASDSPGEDYALITSFRGISGNRVIIIAGTRDAALMQAAEFATNPATLARLDGVARGGQSFEALLGIPAMRNVGLDARVIAASVRPNPSWIDGGKANFPDQFPRMRIGAQKGPG